MVDVDVHIAPASIEVLLDYLPEVWREYVSRTDFAGSPDQVYPPGLPQPRTEPAPGEAVPAEAEAAILVCLPFLDSVRNPYAAEAVARATNDWQLATWLSADGRLRGSIVVASGQPALAAAEVERLGADRRFAQVLLPLRTAIPYGNLAWRPLFEAAERHGLPVAFHFGGAPGNAPTSSGWPSYFAEEAAGAAAIAQVQLASLIAEGVFARCPGLRVVFVEAGFAWLPHWAWRADKDWQLLRREVPWVDRPPSELAQDHVRVTVRPYDGPADADRLATLLHEPPLELARMLLQAGPAPGEDGEGDRLLAALPEPARTLIGSGNARDLYKL